MLLKEEKRDIQIMIEFKKKREKIIELERADKKLPFQKENEGHQER